MKILVDENIPTKVKTSFGQDFHVSTVRDMGWLGKKNGELLGLMTLAGFDVFITLDKNLKKQQNLVKFDIKIILLYAWNNKHETLQPFMDKVQELLKTGNIEKFTEIKL